MNIRPAKTSDIKTMIKIFHSAYKNLSVPSSEEQEFIAELEASFNPKQVYYIRFFIVEINEQTVSFAALGANNFYSGSWEIRWGTTHPKHQNKGLMSTLLEYRINLAIKNTSAMPGVIHVAARNPNIYLKQGFKPIFERGPTNKTTYLVKHFNQEFNQLK